MFSKWPFLPQSRYHHALAVLLVLVMFFIIADKEIPRFRIVQEFRPNQRAQVNPKIKNSILGQSEAEAKQHEDSQSRSAFLEYAVLDLKTKSGGLNFQSIFL